MKRLRLFGVLASLFLSIHSAIGQGDFIFSNGVSVSRAPVFITDPATGECIRPEGDAWSLDVLAGPTGTPVETLQPLITRKFLTGAAAGFAFPATVSVPDVPDRQFADVWVRVYFGNDWATS